MEPSASTPPGRPTPVFDAVLTLAVFALFTAVMRSHVPSNDPAEIWIWAVVTASCLTAVFWLGLQMFHAVWRAQRASGRK